MEGGLPCLQLLMAVVAGLPYVVDQHLQPVHQRRHHVRLQLQQAQGLGALPCLGMAMQVGGDAQVQRLGDCQPLATQQRRQQAQHRRGGHAGDGGSERHRQPLHR